MTTQNQKVNHFLIEMGISPALTDIQETAKSFQQEIQAGLSGKASSLAMIPSFIRNSFSTTDGELVIAIDAGGTNLRISLIQLHSQKVPDIISIKRFPMPGTQGTVSSDDFFDFLARELAEFLKQTTKIGFCFSYAVEILPSRDGKIIALGKEVSIENITGKIIGEELLKALHRNNLPSFSHLTVLNDTTAALIGGQFLCRDRIYSDYIGYILGTGTNICYYENNKNITKAPELFKTGGHTIVNTESGYFDRQFRGTLDQEFWAATQNPSDHHLEKMVSGQYLGSLLLKYLTEASSHNLFSEDASAAISSLKEIQTKNISDYLNDNMSDNPLSVFKSMNDSDLSVFHALADSLLERAAKLVAASIAGCLLETGNGKNADEPVLILMEGSTYIHFIQLKEKILHYIDIEVTRKLGFHVVLKEMDGAVTFGTAYAATAE